MNESNYQYRMSRLRGDFACEVDNNIRHHADMFLPFWVNTYLPPGNHVETHRLLSNALKDDAVGL